MKAAAKDRPPAKAAAARMARRRTVTRVLPRTDRVGVAKIDARGRDLRTIGSAPFPYWESIQPG